jgi:hypothetical protein
VVEARELKPNVVVVTFGEGPSLLGEIDIARNATTCRIAQKEIFLSVTVSKPRQLAIDKTVKCMMRTAVGHDLRVLYTCFALHSAE